MHQLIFSVGYLFLAAAAVAFAWQFRFWQRAVRTEGVIVGWVETIDDENAYRPAYNPRIRFATAKGLAVEFTQPMLKKHADTTGERLPVLYDPAHPSSAKVAALGHVFAWPVALAMLALCSFAYGLS